MHISQFSSRRASTVLTVAGVLLALALTAALALAGPSAQAKTLGAHHHALRHARLQTNALRAETPQQGSQDQTDGPGDTNVQSGDQSAPDTPTEANGETNSGENSAANDGPGGADSGGNCTGDCVQ
jgi:type II secretory pathway pseudopilin PulG